MNWLKSLSYTMALGGVGACVLLLGLSSGIHVAGYEVVIAELTARTTAAVLGAFMIAASIWIESSNRRQLIQEKSPRAAGRVSGPGEESSSVAIASRVMAQDVLYTLDDDVAHSFPKQSSNARRISIFARTAVNLLNAYQNIIVDLCRADCSVRLLCVDPSSDACSTIYGGSRELYAKNFQATAHMLATLKQKVGSRLEVRLTQHAPTFGLLIFEKPEISASCINVQIYFLHARTGRDRPILPVHPGDKWYNVFMDEFEQLWSEALVREPAKLESLIVPTEKV